jgi:hypothetical protein
MVIVDLADGSTDGLYVGPDSRKAQEIIEETVKEGKADAVLLFSNVMPTAVRRPLAEKQLIADQATAAERQQEAVKAARERVVAAKREELKKLTAELKKMEG